MAKLEENDSLAHNIGFHILERFPLGLVKSYKDIAREIGLEPRKDIEEAIFQAGMGPFNITIYKGQDLLPGYKNFMNYLKEQEIRLGIISKGKREYQLEKVNHFILWRWFNLEDIHILEHKTPKNLLEIIKDPNTTLFGTDSLDDVAVALEAGIKVLHIPLPKVYTTYFGNTKEIPLSKKYNRFNSLEFLTSKPELITTLLE